MFPRDRYNPAEFLAGYENGEFELIQPVPGGRLRQPLFNISFTITTPYVDEMGVGFPDAVSTPTGNVVSYGREVCSQIAELDNQVQDSLESNWRKSDFAVESYMLSLCSISITELDASLHYVGDRVNTEWNAIFVRSDSGSWIKHNF